MSDRPAANEPSARLAQLEEAFAFNERAVQRLTSQLEQVSALVFALSRRFDAVEQRMESLRNAIAHPDASASEGDAEDQIDPQS